MCVRRQLELGNSALSRSQQTIARDGDVCFESQLLTLYLRVERQIPKSRTSRATVRLLLLLIPPATEAGGRTNGTQGLINIVAELDSPKAYPGAGSRVTTTLYAWGTADARGSGNVLTRIVPNPDGPMAAGETSTV